MNTPEKAVMATMSIAVILLVGGCNAKRRDLLCKTDLDAVVRASRKLLAKASTGELMLGPHEFQREPHSPEIAKFPQVIRELKPTRVLMEPDGWLSIQFGGGFDHFGLKVYPEDFKPPFPDFNYGARKIVDGLWYYDDNYSDEYPRHKKRIDRWIQMRNKRSAQDANMGSKS
jgi:hypothetical protein